MIDREVEQAMEDAGNMPCWLCQKPATGKDVLKMAWCDECYTKASEPMTDEQRGEQRRSFAYGNVALSNPDVTREIVDQQAEKLKQENKNPYTLYTAFESLVHQLNGASVRYSYGGRSYSIVVSEQHREWFNDLLKRAKEER